MWILFQAQKLQRYQKQKIQTKYHGYIHHFTSNEN